MIFNTGLYVLKYFPILEKLLCLLFSPIDITMALFTIIDNYDSENNIKIKYEIEVYYLILVFNTILYHLLLIIIEYISKKKRNEWKF